MKTFIITLFFIIYSSFSFSQEIGFHVGVNFVNQFHKNLPDDLPEYKGIRGIRLGVDLTKKFSKNLNLMIGVNFDQKGGNGNWNSNETTFVYKIKNTLNYIEVPVSILICNADLQTTPYISFGAYASMLISGKFGDTSRYEIRDIFKKNDYGIRISTGIKVDRLRFDLGYDLGLQNLNTFGNEFIIKNRSCNLTVRYFPKI